MVPASRASFVADLARRAPPAAWEAYFLIGVFPEASPLRWCKVQIFSGGRDLGRTCLSAIEGMDGPGRLLVLAGRSGSIEERSRLLRQGELQRSPDGWHVRLDGLDWAGSYPELRLDCSDPGFRADTRTEERLVWLRLPRVLTYWSAFGSVDWEGADGRARGAGIVEHAWGADSRLPVTRLAPSWWHWDVLAFDDGSTAAGLAVAFAGQLRGVRGGGRITGEPFAIGRGPSIRVLDWTDQAARPVPARWSGRWRLGAVELEYEARASTPVAAVLTRGGFLGFTFEGEAVAGVLRRQVRGAGFCEYARCR
ncbi:MAG: hypothetical protein HYY06_27430 [Deltaproteobacteria bacterium]|nr:hypothetical protein [Deltaproteobacteria bacterium]